MFTSFFQMASLPFREKAATGQIIKDERITQGLARLQYMSYQGNIALVYGATGLGKSTLLKLFLAQLPQNQFLPVIIHFTDVKATSLLNLIVSGLGEIPKHTKVRLFTQIMDKVINSNFTILLIIDEAHLLSVESIVDLRLLLSSPSEDCPAIKIILSGQDTIKHTLKRDTLTDFADRVSVVYHLEPLTKTQTSAYIDLQLKNVHASKEIFPQEVKDMIHECATGNPRRINNIATGCLINGCIHKSQKINLDILKQTIKEIPFI